MRNFDQIQVNDKVRLFPPFRGERQVPTIETVTRVTKTQFVVKGRKYRKIDGTPVGTDGTNRYSNCQPY